MQFNQPKGTDMKQSALANLTQFMSNAPIEKTSLSMPPMAQPLLPHQITGAEFALKERTVLIADEQGVGKTATAIAIATASVIAGMRVCKMPLYATSPQGFQWLPCCPTACL